ncbi:LysR family transcriptional regulator [Leisingera thetidis]|uniref:LysR family transcriptional regulator n=1 Tax=Leisingera thetidis TaxID=2930199 RepID=UPI0021F718C0|nr:LysR family transcriptional regulator [Leisingera thetidis]
MELKWLQDFVALATSRSFSRAAVERNVTQPAYSRRIRSLENWIGVPLFDRSTYPVQLTPAGEEFLPRARTMITEINLTRRDLRQIRSDFDASVRVLALHTLTFSVLPPVITEFAKLDPKGVVTVLPSVQAVEEYFETLASGLADIVVTYQTPGLQLGASELAQFELREVGRDVLRPVAAPALAAELGPDWLAAKAPVVPFLSYSEYSFSDKLIAPVLIRHHDKLRPVMKSTLGEGLRQVALLGRGVAWLPETLIRGDLEAGRLAVLPGTDLEIGLSIVAYRLPVGRNRGVELFWDLLPEAARGQE